MWKASKFLGFIALSIAMFLGTMDSTIINIALPTITDHFHSTLSDTSWISTIYVLGISVFMITASKIADQFGRKKAMIIGLVLFGGSSAMCGLSSSLIVLIAMRFIQGIGCAIITPIVVPIGLDAFGKEKTTVIASAIGAITALAAAGGPPIGGLLLEYANWQAIFFINVPFVLLALILTIFFVRESYDETVSKSIDWIGMVLLTATLFLLTFALLKGNDYGWGSTLIISMLAGAVVSLGLFLLAERKVRSPMMEFALFKEMTFTASVLSYMLTGFAMIVPGLIFNYYLQNVMGYTPLHASLIVTPLALTVIISMPVGTFISKKLDARMINFLGLFGMGIGAFLLSKVTVHTSEATMIAEMVVYGFALGFSVQALLSSIKYILQEKSGIGSGIVNSARYIGACISIAILVSILTMHVTDAKNNIRDTAVADINGHKAIAESVRKVMTDDIVKVTEETGDNNLQKSDFQNQMEKDIRDALDALATVPADLNDEVLKELYDGAAALNDGAGKAADGQKKLGQGIDDLNTGLSKLHDGSASLADGAGAVKEGLAQITDGAKQLEKASAKGSADLISGAKQLDSGAKSMLSQFSSGDGGSTPTVYDAVTGVASGSQALSGGMDSYLSLVNNTLFTIIKNDPASPTLLSGYKDTLAKTQAAYAQATADVKPQLLQKMQMLANLVNLYAVGTDASITSTEQFSAKLAALAQQDGSNATVVSGGAQVKAGAAQLAGAAGQLAAQFGDNGSFKQGMEQLADGTGKLTAAGGKLTELQNGIGTLTSSLDKLRDGTASLETGAAQLKTGVEQLQDGGASLKTGSEDLTEASGDIKDGTVELEKGIALAGQKSEIEGIVDRLYENKDKQVAGAFGKTFLIAAIILMVTSVLGLFTDKSVKETMDGQAKA